MCFRLALALISLCLPMLLAEGFLRLRGSASHDLNVQTSRMALLMQMHEQGNYLTLPVGKKLRGWGHDIQLNRLGMRDPEPVIPKPEGTRRILILGDSFAFGQGVAQDETVSSLLRSRLLREGVDVVTGAMPGWNTLEQERFLKLNLAELDPDLVLILYVINDRELDNPFRRARLDAEGFAQHLYRRLLVDSRLFEWAAFTYRKAWPGAMDSIASELTRWAVYQRRTQPGKRYSHNDLGWQRSRKALLRIQETMRARGCESLLYFIRDEPGGPGEEAFEALSAMGERSGISVMDALPYYEGRHRVDVVLNVLVDPHPNALGHSLLAKGIEASLFRLGWLQDESR